MVREILLKAANAAASVQSLDDSVISDILKATACELRNRTEEILAANREDLSRMSEDNPRYDRLLLSAARLDAIASDMENVAGLPSPLGRKLAEWTRPNGMQITKISVPFGVIGVIYEARPNVTADVFSLCLKSGNVCVLKGGSDADSSNRAVAGVIKSVLDRYGVDNAACTLLPATREATAELLTAVGLVDLIIPRGSGKLISYVRENAKVPVIETGAGICHTYFDAEGDVDKAAAIVNNAKTRRVSVCNALDCLIVHSSRLSDLPYLCKPLISSNVVVYADAPAMEALKGFYPESLLREATEDSYGTEFLDYEHQNRGLFRSGPRPHSPIQFPPQRVHSQRKPSDHRPVLEKSGCSLCLCQCLHSLHGRCPVRFRGRNRHLHPETPRPRPYGPSRAHHLQIPHQRLRSDPAVIPGNGYHL